MTAHPKGRVEILMPDGNWGTICGHFWFVSLLYGDKHGMYFSLGGTTNMGQKTCAGRWVFKF